MRNYIILNGVNSNTITGLLISTLPPITKPKIRTQTEEIDGRDGDIVTKLGYSAYDKEIEIGLYGNFDINEVIAYFNTEGTVVFSNEADKYYNYQILDQIDYEKLIRFKTAKVKMHVQPFKYPLEETPVEINIENVTGEGETTSLDNTAEAPVTIALKGNTSQDGTPTPDAPVEVNTVTGRQEINIVGKNIFDYSVTEIGKAWNNSSNSARAVAYTPVIPNAKYTVSFTGSGVDSVGCFFKVNKTDTTIVDNIYTISGARTFTIPATANWIGIQYNKTNIQMSDVKNIKLQIEKGEQATAYEPYQSQSYELDLGKNLFNYVDNLKTDWRGLTSTINNDGSITTTGIPLYNYTSIIQYDLTNMLENGATYTLWQQDLQPNLLYLQMNITDNNGGATQYASLNNASNISFIADTINKKYIINLQTGTTSIWGNSSREITNYYQLEKGDTASSFAPYKTPIEVNYIPNTEYQDYFYKDNNKWYIKRQVGKVIFDGSENWSTRSSGVGQLYELNVSSYGFYNTENQTLGFSNQYKANINLNVDNTFRVLSGATLGVHNDTIGSLANYKSGLSDNNLIVYYPLKTPEDEEVTDNTLIGQLNALENARSYDTTTHINQNTANKPFIINATAVQKGSDTGNVDNIGNIYAKPTIDIEGSGIVEIYLDGNQIFNVDLSTINECVIDTTNLEAYNPATTQLMNRQVTGDYSNFKINVGDNQVKVSGAVTKATISNYTRWL